ncbi:hypothetical protein FEZ18_09590 [Oceanihabitans sp. IOP_32]|uniref:hypothetical protein n=1 Tax=Oceanihabitans sp. IOP_32 TaxID=2529032 RepID=UPI0012939BAA|nr:hypothetical protein [Oceanihabitans sp. IOP_32]QFZ55027.1 hypothetical protein FEZ18_09590 [Oceanihabitans sp. IOP_32]
MKENANKHLDNFTKKIIQKASLEHPSIHFTSEIMSQVTTLHSNQATVYKPLISKKLWVLMALGFILLCFYFVLGAEKQEESWFRALDFSVLSKNKFANVFSDFTISETLKYGLLFFGLMLCIQILFLKNYFDKRLEV